MSSVSLLPEPFLLLLLQLGRVLVGDALEPTFPRGRLPRPVICQFCALGVLARSLRFAQALLLRERLTSLPFGLERCKLA